MYHINRKGKKQKRTDNVQYPFKIKTFGKLGLEGKFLNMIKNIYEKPTGNITLKDKKLKAFFLRSGTS